MIKDKTIITLDMIYKVTESSFFPTYRDFTPNIWINSGYVDIYVSNSDTIPISIGDFSLSDTKVGAIKEINSKTLPDWILFKQNSGTSTEVIVTGLTLEEVAEVST